MTMPDGFDGWKLSYQPGDADLFLDCDVECPEDGTPGVADVRSWAEGRDLLVREWECPSCGETHRTEDDGSD